MNTKKLKLISLLEETNKSVKDNGSSILVEGLTPSEAEKIRQSFYKDGLDITPQEDGSFEFSFNTTESGSDDDIYNMFRDNDYDLEADYDEEDAILNANDECNGEICSSEDSDDISGILSVCTDYQVEPECIDLYSDDADKLVDYSINYDVCPEEICGAENSVENTEELEQPVAVEQDYYFDNDFSGVDAGVIGFEEKPEADMGIINLADDHSAEDYDEEAIDPALIDNIEKENNRDIKDYLTVESVEEDEKLSDENIEPALKKLLIHNKEVLFGADSKKLSDYKAKIEKLDIEKLKDFADEDMPTWRKHIEKYIGSEELNESSNKIIYKIETDGKYLKKTFTDHDKAYDYACDYLSRHEKDNIDHVAVEKFVDGEYEDDIVVMFKEPELNENKKINESKEYNEDEDVLAIIRKLVEKRFGKYVSFVQEVGNKVIFEQNDKTKYFDIDKISDYLADKKLKYYTVHVDENPEDEWKIDITVEEDTDQIEYDREQELYENKKISEATKPSNNEAWGYHGVLLNMAENGEIEGIDRIWDETFSALEKEGYDEDFVQKFLDSRMGRHFGDAFYNEIKEGKIAETIHQKIKEIKEKFISWFLRTEVNTINESVTLNESWGDFDIFSDRLEKYLPPTGEGETKASQYATALSKLVYRWFNDGDVYDNNYGMEGFGNDLSPYANWLYEHIDGAEVLKRIEKIGNDESRYENILLDLCSLTCTEDRLEKLAQEPKEGSIYKCDGPFSLGEHYHCPQCGAEVDSWNTLCDDCWEEQNEEDEDLDESVESSPKGLKAIKDYIIDHFGDNMEFDTIETNKIYFNHVSYDTNQFSIEKMEEMLMDNFKGYGFEIEKDGEIGDQGEVLHVIVTDYHKNPSDESSKNDSVKEWYIKEYPEEKDFVENTDPSITFADIYNDPASVYDLLNDIDSMVRENVFRETAKRFGVNYDNLYYRWVDQKPALNLDESYNGNYETIHEEFINTQNREEAICNLLDCGEANTDEEAIEIVDTWEKEMDDSGYYEDLDEARDENNIDDIYVVRWYGDKGSFESYESYASLDAAKMAADEGTDATGYAQVYNSDDKELKNCLYDTYEDMISKQDEEENDDETDDLLRYLKNEEDYEEKIDDDKELLTEFEGEKVIQDLNTGNYLIDYYEELWTPSQDEASRFNSVEARDTFGALIEDGYDFDDIKIIDL